MRCSRAAGTKSANMFGLTFTRKLVGAKLHQRPPLILGGIMPVQYLVIAGGGGSGRGNGTLGGNAGGGAGGYRNSTLSETTGGGGVAESVFGAALETAYTITVGAGGTGFTGSSGKGGTGANSVFATITSSGGGGAGCGATSLGLGLTGGSSGGVVVNSGVAPVAPTQGFASGNSVDGGSGGGGAGAASANTTGSTGTAGGVGLSSAITGTGVFRGGGGGGGNDDGNPSPAGGNGGGGAGAVSFSVQGTTGTINTGGGAGASGYNNVNGVNGGSGTIILRSMRTAAFSGGVTFVSSVSGGFYIYTITAAGVSDTVTFS